MCVCEFIFHQGILATLSYSGVLQCADICACSTLNECGGQQDRKEHADEHEESGSRTRQTMFPSRCVRRTCGVAFSLSAAARGRSRAIAVLR